MSLRQTLFLAARGDFVRGGAGTIQGSDRLVASKANAAVAEDISMLPDPVDTVHAPPGTPCCLRRVSSDHLVIRGSRYADAFKLNYPLISVP